MKVKLKLGKNELVVQVVEAECFHCIDKNSRMKRGIMFRTPVSQYIVGPMTKSIADQSMDILFRTGCLDLTDLEAKLFTGSELPDLM